MNTQRTLEQAIRNEVRELWERDISEDKALDLYQLNDRYYQRTVNHKTRRGAAELYIRREGCALYLKERYGVDLK